MTQPAPSVRKGMPSPRLDEATFRSRFADPVFEPLGEELDVDLARRKEVRNAALTLAQAAHANHAGTLLQAGRDLPPPRRK